MYRIVDWERNFENNRSRELKKLDWVPVPNKQAGDGYTELITDHENGAAHYGAWCAMILLASKCDPRGTLVRDGARPHDIRSIERITRIPSRVLEEAIPRLIHINWMEIIDAQDHEIALLRESRTNPAPACGLSATERLRKGKELNPKSVKAEPGEETEKPSVDWDRVLERANWIAAQIPSCTISHALAWCRVGYLMQTTFGESEISDAIKQTLKRDRAEPPGYFIGVLRGVAKKGGWNLQQAMNSIVVDEDLVRSVDLIAAPSMRAQA